MKGERLIASIQINGEKQQKTDTGCPFFVF